MATRFLPIYILEGNKSSQPLCEAALGTSSQLACIAAGFTGTVSFQSSIPAPAYVEGEDTWTVPVHTYTVYVRGLPDEVPEPGGVFVMLTGLVGLGLRPWRRLSARRRP